MGKFLSIGRRKLSLREDVGLYLEVLTKSFSYKLVMNFDCCLKLDEGLQESKSCSGLILPVVNELKLKASGSLPAPRSGHATTIMEGKVCTNLC